MRQEILNHATQDLTNLLLEVVRDYHDTWMSARKNLENKPEYQRYVDLLGIIFIWCIVLYIKCLMISTKQLLPLTKEKILLPKYFASMSTDCETNIASRCRMRISGICQEPCVLSWQKFLLLPAPGRTRLT